MSPIRSKPEPDRFVGRDVVVIGGGDSATLDALALAREGSPVTLVHRSQALHARDDIVEQVRNEARIEDLAGWELESLDGGDRLEGVTVLRHADGQRRRLEVGGLVVKIGRVPRTDLFRDQLDVDGAGAIVVDREMRTSRDGVFAAGDVVAGAYPRVRGGNGRWFARRAIGAPAPARPRVMAAHLMNVPSVTGIVAEFRHALREPTRLTA